MHRLTADSLKLGAPIVLLGGASLLGWAGVIAQLLGRAEPPPGFWAGLTPVALGNLMLMAIVGLLAWVMSDPA